MSLQVKEEKGDRTSIFYCDVCECTLRDSSSYDDHIRGENHNRKLGISLKNFTDSTLEEVQEMLEFKKRQRDKRDQGDAEQIDGCYGEHDEEKYRAMKREKKKRQKARRAGRYNDDKDEYDEDNEGDEGKDADRDKAGSNERAGVDDESEAMAKLLGFSSFSSSKN